MPSVDTRTTPNDASRLLAELCSHRLPAAVLREAQTAGAGRVALYVIDIDGSCLLKLSGDDDFPERLQTPVGVGPELTIESLGEVREIVASKAPDADLVPLRVRDRAVGILLADGGDAGRLQVLADDAGLALELAGGYTDVVHRVRRRKEINAAAEIQQDLLPPRIASVDGAHLAGGVLPGYQVGGDFFDYADNEDGLWLAVGDAMGKGNGAAAISSLAVGALRAARRNDATLEQAAQAVHEATFDLGGPYQFLTAILAVWHRDTGMFTWINCGHPQPLLVDADGTARELEADGTYPLGMFRRGREFHRREHHIEPGQRILLYSDGIPERRAGDGELYGGERLKDVLRDCADAPTARAVRALQDAVIGFSERPLRDDATLLLIDVDPAPAQGSTSPRRIA